MYFMNQLKNKNKNVHSKLPHRAFQLLFTIKNKNYLTLIFTNKIETFKHYSHVHKSCASVRPRPHSPVSRWHPRDA